MSNLASVLNERQKAHFDDLVRAAFKRHGMDVEICGHEARQDGFTCNLHPLAEACEGAWSIFWPGRIDREVHATLAMDEPFDRLRDRLAVVLYPQLHASIDGVVRRVDLEGTQTVLVVRSKTRTAWVREAVAAGWGQHHGALFDMARDNRRGDKNYRVDTDANDMKIVTGDHASTRALDLPEHGGWIGRHGAMVALPDVDTLHCLPLDRDVHDVEAMVRQFCTLQAATRIDEYSFVTDSVYWYYDRSFCRVQGGVLPRPLLELVSSP